MTRIATVTGKVIDFLNPDPAQICLDDIVAGLKAMPRFTGQTIRPWSVLQHSLLVAFLCAPENTLHGLLHDATEAYIADVSSPMKQAMRGHRPESDYDIIESRLWRAICARWDLSPELPDDVKAADIDAMLIEAPRLQPKGWEHPVWQNYHTWAIPPDAISFFYRLQETSAHDCVAMWLLEVGKHLGARKVAA